MTTTIITITSRMMTISLLYRMEIQCQIGAKNIDNAVNVSTLLAIVGMILR